MIGAVAMMSSSVDKVSDNRNAGVTAIYLVFAALGMVVYHLIAEGQFSSVLTFAAMGQCLAFSLLAVQVLSHDNVHGVSAKSLSLDALALVCRLSSTTWLNGYLPADATGDFLYQALDFFSLGMVAWLLHRVLCVKRRTYDADEDAFPLAPFVAGAFLLACLINGDLNDRPIFDTLWMFGLNISAIAVLPQLWMMTRGKRAIPALTCHFVAVMAFARILSGTYMWAAHSEITCEPWIGDFMHTGYAIMAAHAIHLLTLGDFAYFYAKNLAMGGLAAPLDLTEAWIV
jgi:hypothetical protein